MSGGESTGNSHPTAARIKAQRANQIGAAANKMRVLTAGPAASTASGEFIRVSRWDGKGLVRLACSFDHTTEEADRLATGIAYLHR